MKFNVLKNHKVVRSFTTEGNHLKGMALPFINEYAKTEKTKGTIEAYTMRYCGGVANLLSLERSGDGIMLVKSTNTTDGNP